MIACARPMLGEKALHNLAAEKSPFQGSGLQQEALQFFELPSRQPVSPGGWESHLLAMHDLRGEQICHR